MRIGVTISRDWDDYDAVVTALSDATRHLRSGRITLVHGASQMDWFIAGVAYMLGMTLEAHHADWEAFGRKAGPIRNQEMVDSGADLWLAFIKGNSRGASGCAALAEQAGIPVRRHTA